MQEQEYIDSRLDDQINWYDNKNRFNQKWYKGLRLIEIVFAATIPFLSGMGSIVPHHQIIIGALGVCIAVSAGLSALYKFHENWIQYRATAEALKHEKFLFLTKCAPYDGERAFGQLVQRVEGLLSKENIQWSMQPEKGDNA